MGFGVHEMDLNMTVLEVRGGSSGNGYGSKQGDRPLDHRK